MSDSDDQAVPTDDNDELIRKVMAGDSDSLAAYINVCQAQLTGFIRSISSDRLLSVVEVDDLYQEVCTAALAGFATAPMEKYTPMQWLQQISRRRVVDAHRFHFEAQRREAGRQQSLHGGPNAEGGGLEAMLSASFTSPSAAFSRDVRMIRMQAAIEELGDEARQAVQLRYAEGLASKEIAERLDKSDAAVRVLLSRSLRILEKKLSDVKPTR